MAYADQQMSGSRVVAIIIVVLIHVALGYALVTGLAYSAIEAVVERVATVNIDEPPPPPEDVPPPPPPPENTAPPPPVAPPPPISVAVNPPQIVTQVNIPPPAPIAVVAPPPAPPGPPPAPPPPPPPSQARALQPDNQASWQRRIIENYPARAVRDGTEGTVGLSVTVDGNGRVASCNVTSSSGSSVLDQAACTDITRYARFKAALDAAGNPTTASWSTRIVYRLD